LIEKQHVQERQFTTIRENIIEILKSVHGKHLSYAEVMNLYQSRYEPNVNPNSIARQLRQLREDGKIKSDENGHFWISMTDDKTKKLSDFFQNMIKYSDATKVGTQEGEKPR
jgi:Fe2+ or Zn2+ uptake regulation protein